MKRFFPALLALIFVSSAGAGKTVSTHPEGYEAALNAAVHHLDSVLVNALNSLELVASTPEAKNGDWNAIKRYLVRLEAGLPGVYFFVLPNGNYYTTTKDYTNLNLSDRPYFKSLFAGNPVKGFPIYSRSTGKKSAVLAVPIMVDKEVAGALGISVFLDSLTAQLSRVLALPPEYTWFVVNSEGNTMLDRDRDYIFMNAITQGSASLRKAVTEALKSDSGTTQYKLETIRHARYQKLPSLDWWMFLVIVEGGKAPVEPQLRISLERFVPDLQGSLTKIDESLTRLIDESRINLGQESEVRALLHALLEENIYIVEAAYVDPKGILRYIEPRDYKNFENEDISAQPHIVAMRKNPVPMFTGAFTAVEDFLAVIDLHPVYENGTQFAGSVNLVIRPELMIDALLKKTSVPDDYELWVMQTDGMIIYDQDKNEIGKMLFSDPMYKGYESLRDLGKKIVSNPAGEGSYIFLGPELNEKVIKKALWRTVSLNNREWRVVLAYRPYEQ